MREEIIQLIKASLEDDVLISSEKKELKSVIHKSKIDQRDADFLRSQFFDMARAKINSTNFHQIIDWLENTNKLFLHQKDASAPNETVYFSPGEDCLNGILSQIKLSHSSIEICLFTISDDRISDALIYKHHQGVRIRIITDNDKIFDQGSDIAKLATVGIPIKVDITDNHMHHKFALFDNKHTLTGSYNWTRSAERYNHENILITDSETVFKSFTKEFEILWHELVEYEKIG